jgi:hypothetical protein
MSGEIGAAADVATGALIGRAVESRAGEQGGEAHGHGACLNCGTTLIGDYCHACGQNGHVHKTLTSIGHDLLHGVFHFEGKIWRTLPMLVTRPGQLTRRYIDGERVRFVSPLALFLFFVFLMFATIHSMPSENIGTDLANLNPTQLNPAQRDAAVRKLDAQIATHKTDLAQIEAQRSTAKAAGQDTDALDERRESEKDAITGMNTARGLLVAGKAPDLSNARTGWAALDEGLAKAKANPELALYKLQSSAYKYSWALIPISVPFVALLFLWRRRFRLYDHAIFVTYSLSFMMLGTTVVTLLMLVGAPGWTYGNLIAFGPPVHLFFQLRGAYGLNWFSALWRTFALLIFAAITLTLFLLLLLGLGLMD